MFKTNTVSQYYISLPDHSFGTFTISDEGDLFIHSDWGYYFAVWRNTGTETFKKWLLSIDHDYLITNLERNARQFYGVSKKIPPRSREAILALWSALKEELRKEPMYRPNIAATDVYKAYVLDVINKYWATLKEFPYVSDFSKLYQVKPEIIELEKMYPEIGYGSGYMRMGIEEVESNISTISIISTISDLLAGKRLAAVISDDNKITSWTWYHKS